MNCKMLFFIGVALKIAVSNKLVYNVSAFFQLNDLQAKMFSKDLH